MKFHGVMCRRPKFSKPEPVFQSSPANHLQPGQASLERPFAESFGLLSWSNRWGSAELEPDVVYLRSSKYVNLTEEMKNAIPKKIG